MMQYNPDSADYSYSVYAELWSIYTYILVRVEPTRLFKLAIGLRSD